VPDPNQSLRFRIRQRFDENPIYYAEDGCVRPNAERERNQCDSGKHWGPPESPEDLPQGSHEN
jgi:hypothetical protein